MGCQHGNAITECPDRRCQGGTNTVDDLADFLATRIDQSVRVRVRKPKCEQCRDTNAVCVECGLYADCEHVRAGARRIDCPVCCTLVTNPGLPQHGVSLFAPPGRDVSVK